MKMTKVSRMFYETSCHTPLFDCNKYLAQVDDLTSDKVRDCAARVFQEDNSFTGYVLPKA